MQAEVLDRSSAPEVVNPATGHVAVGNLGGLLGEHLFFLSNFWNYMQFLSNLFVAKNFL